MLIISKKDKPLFDKGQPVVALDEEDFASHFQVIKGDDGLPHLYVTPTHRKYTAVIPAVLSLTVLNLTFAETEAIMKSETHTTFVYRSAQSTGMTRKEQIEKGIAEVIKVTAVFNGDEKATDADRENPSNYSYTYEYVTEQPLGAVVEIR
jgi:hypothetical protein